MFITHLLLLHVSANVYGRLQGGYKLRRPTQHVLQLVIRKWYQVYV